MEKILNVELDKKNINLKEFPFPYFSIDNFVEAELFKEMVKDYHKLLPEMNFRIVEPELWRLEEPKGTTYVFGGGIDGDTIEKFETLTKNSEAWRKLLNYMNSSDFMFSLMKIFEDTSPCKERIGKKKLTYRQGSYKRSIWDKLFNFSCYMNFKISRYTNNVGLLQHQDHGFKVVALLLYLDNTGFEKDSSAGTQMWSNEKNTKLADWKEYTLTPEERSTLILHEDIQYVPNRLAVFLRSPNSWHGVVPVNIPSHLTRDTLQINVMTSHKQAISLKIAHLVNLGVKKLKDVFISV